MRRYHHLGQLFSQVVEQQGDKKAICFGERCYSYHELDQDSDRAMSGLLQNSARQSGVVAIPATKNYSVYVTLLACLKLGIPYSFYDTKSPAPRVLVQMEVLDEPLVVTDHHIDEVLLEPLQENYRCCDVEVLMVADVQQIQLDEQRMRVGDSSIAYIMFTSGSTGVPKGVAISHSNLFYLIDWAVNQVGVTTGDRLSGLNKQYFDNSVFDLYASLFTGATLCPVDDELLIDSALLFRYLERQQVSIWFSVPSLLVYHLSLGANHVASLSAIRKFIFGGEAFPKSSLQQLWKLYQERSVELLNVYGPTECTCICSLYRVSEEDFTGENMGQIAPVGIISDYFDYAVVDEENHPVALGEPGELLLGGGAVGQGYWGRADLTEKAFIPNPRCDKLQDRYYKTGDLVRERESGELEFISRVDLQIKHMGHRIELPEIESVVLSGGEVVEACAVYKTRGSAGYIQLYYNGEMSESAMKGLLESRLPSYMRPRLVTRMGQLPKNRNGKIDRRQLGE